MRFLKQSTSVVVQLGPFVDATDGFTDKTALSPAAADVTLAKAGGTTLTNIGDQTWTHMGNGLYRVTLSTAHTDTAGPLVIHGHIAGARHVFAEFNVLAATAYDALMSGSALPSNMTQIVGNSTAATLAVFPALTIQSVTVGSGSSVTRVATNLTESVADHWNGRSLVFITGALAKQATTITDYNGTTKELTVAALTSAPAAGDLAVIV
jgi:hypothetical protein